MCLSVKPGHDFLGKGLEGREEHVEPGGVGWQLVVVNGTADLGGLREAYLKERAAMDGLEMLHVLLANPIGFEEVVKNKQALRQKGGIHGQGLADEPACLDRKGVLQHHGQNDEVSSAHAADDDVVVVGWGIDETVVVVAADLRKAGPDGLGGHGPQLGELVVTLDKEVAGAQGNGLT